MVDSKNTLAIEDKIFSKYESRNSGSVILKDGIVDPEAYWDKDNFRVLFVLKEANDPDGFWSAGNDLRDFAASGARYPTWANLACWSACARSTQFDPANRKKAEWQGAQLRHSAFVNLKKVPGKAHADNQAVLDFSLNHADLLVEQISLYQPHLTLACGLNTFHALEKIFDGIRKKEPDVYFYMDHPMLGKAIDFYHPQARLHGGMRKFLDRLRVNLTYHFVKKISS